MALLTILLLGIVSLVAYFVLSALYKFRKYEKYLKENDVPYLGASLWRTVQFFLSLTNLTTIELEIYKEAKDKKAPLVGLSDAFGSASLYIMDLDLVKNIYVKDFDHFINRREIQNLKTTKYLSKMLFAMEGEPWKGIRAKLSPSFTTSKIRRMFVIFKRSSERMDAYVKEQMKSNAKSMDLNLSQVFPKYAMDVIASCAFGIDGKCWEVPPDQKSTFEQMGSQLQFNFKVLMKFMLSLVFPKLTEMMGMDVMDHEASAYFSGVIRDVMKRRRQTGERQEDFLQLMMDAQQGLLKADEETNQVMNGSVDGKLGLEDDIAKGKVKFEDDDIVANAMLFMLAGFDTTQSVLLFTIYSLALEQNVQQRLFEEIQLVKEKNGGELKYEAVLEMNYLDWVINETMRLFPPSAKTERCCTQDYLVPGTKFVIKKGTIAGISVHAIHRDPQYFPDPEKFIPERFSPEGKENRHSMAFMPFGHGPRNCIGMRFALVKVKTVIAQLVASYHFTPCSRTKVPMEFDNNANLKPKDDMWINVSTRS